MNVLLKPLHLLLLVTTAALQRQNELALEMALDELRMYKKRHARIRLTDDERRVLAVKGKAIDRRLLEKMAVIVRPDTILRWHRQLIARKWDYSAKRKTPGRSKTPKEIEELVLRMAQENVDPRDRRCRIANRAMRMVYQLVGGRQVWRGRGVDREYLLSRLQEFHRLHHTAIDQTLRDLNQAFEFLPRSAYAAEAKPLAALVRPKRRGPQRIGDLLVPLLLRLGVDAAELGVDGDESLQSNTSEARSPA